MSSNCHLLPFLHIILYLVTRLPGNPVTGRGGDVDAVDMICELAQVAYIAITAVILTKQRSIKVVEKEQLRQKYITFSFYKIVTL